MRQVRCYDCGKTYDYDDDGFCPRCGAFNPVSWAAAGAAGTVNRVDGLDERGHRGSFLHKEPHKERAEQRRRAGSSQDVQRTAQTVSKTEERASSRLNRWEAVRKSPAVWIVGVVVAIVALNIVINLFAGIVSLIF